MRFTLWALVVLSVVVITVAVSRSDTAPPSLPTTAPTEPLTGTPATTVPGNETARHDPFTPYSIGKTARGWQYSELTPTEQAVADKGRDVTGWDTVHSAYGNVAKDMAREAASDAAAQQLGIDGVANTGVIP